MPQNNPKQNKIPVTRQDMTKPDIIETIIIIYNNTVSYYNITNISE